MAIAITIPMAMAIENCPYGRHSLGKGLLRRELTVGIKNYQLSIINFYHMKEIPIRSLIVIIFVLAHYMLSSQNVGINTDDPKWPFHIWESGQVPSTILVLGDSLEARMELGFNRIQSKTGVSSLPLLLQYEGGNVGINISGISSPQAPLHVWDPGQVSSTLLFLGHEIEARLELAFDRIQSKTSSASLPLFLQHEGGNLGIGPDFPQSKLHITEGVDASFTQNGYFMIGSNTGANVIFDDNEILARNNGLEAPLFMQRDSGDLLLCALERGAVGIGITGASTMPAGYLLAVDGNAIFEEVRVELSQDWPDYVFDEAYDLRPLAELEREIKHLGHLPGFHSAEVFNSEGSDLGETQRLMMEKIEELTLYVIELEKQNNISKRSSADNEQTQALLDESLGQLSSLTAENERLNRKLLSIEEELAEIKMLLRKAVGSQVIIED
jgi:hypothetical protein